MTTRVFYSDKYDWQKNKYDKFLRKQNVKVKDFIEPFASDGITIIIYDENSVSLLNETDSKGFSAIHHTLYNEKFTDKQKFFIIEGLMKHGADPFILTIYGKCAFICACELGYLEIVKIMCEHKNCNVNVTSLRSWPAIQFAIEANKLQVAEFLLSKGASITMSSTCGESMYHTIARVGDGSIRSAKTIIEHLSQMIELKDNRGRTPLHIACTYGRLPIIELLLEHGADNTIIDNAGETPTKKLIDWFNAKGSKLASDEVFQYLQQTISVDTIRYIISIVHNKTTSNGDTKMHDAVRKNNIGYITKRIANKKLINTENDNALTPLLLAIKCNNVEAFKTLLLACNDINQTNSQGLTPLNLASAVGNTDIVKILLEQDNIDVNKSDKGGFSPLHNAARGQFDEILTMLADKKANIYAIAKDGRSVYRNACFVQRLSISTMMKLLILGVKINDKEGDIGYKIFKNIFTGAIALYEQSPDYLAKQCCEFMKKSINIIDNIHKI
ncbi:poly [ADP-ribose] polymerase tankyrase-2-like [Hydra vulgaris]|uniref:Poly [ADP-ribose] polymerase tankyrase-2-like n=1 Tax=Hydra vulgaris TaxID=6087 RepID=A0ABM4C590_HYDVU